jgi:hypothetical protein
MLMMLRAIARQVGAEIEHDEEMAVLAQDTELETVIEHIKQNEAQVT